VGSNKQIVFGLIVICGACGDNSKLCGPGTSDQDGDGVCESTVAEIRCGDGTRMDTLTQQCTPDPAICTNGTQLLNNRCRDPAGTLDIDIEEGPEPNGLEPEAVPAGLVSLEPVGSDGFVIHGCITPTADEEPDLDAYTLTVTAPTLVRITADGVGLTAGFEVTSSVAALGTWKRFGVGIATDAARRQVLLPAAGAYRVIIADTRTLLPEITGGATTPPAGNPDGTSCYFVTIDQQTIAPAALDLATGDSGSIDQDIKLYAPVLPSGTVQLTSRMMTPHAQEAIVVLRNGQLHAFDDDGSITISGFASGDTAVVAADFVYQYAVFPVPYQLTSP
jgi:hypothetical protein